MPGQLVFGRDIVLNVQHLTDWTAIKAHKHSTKPEAAWLATSK
jgi:hypothetical protein